MEKGGIGMIEKILGFYEKDIKKLCYLSASDNPNDNTWWGHDTDIGDLPQAVKDFCDVPVVSLEEHQKYLDAGARLKMRVIELEMEVKRLKGMKVVSLEWLEEYIEKRRKSFRNSESDYGKGVRNGLDYLLLSAKKEAGV